MNDRRCARDIAKIRNAESEMLLVTLRDEQKTMLHRALRAMFESGRKWAASKSTARLAAGLSEMNFSLAANQFICLLQSREQVAESDPWILSLSLSACARCSESRFSEFQIFKERFFFSLFDVIFHENELTSKLHR